MQTSPSTVRAPPDPKRLSWRGLALLFAGLLLFGVALARAGLPAIGGQLARVGPRAAWLLLPYAVGTAMSAAPWALLLSPSSRPSPLAVVAGRFVASSANALLPFFGLAGEPARLLWLELSAKGEGLAAIVVDRVLYNASNGLILLAGAAVAFWATSLPLAVSLGAAAAAAATLAITVVALWAAVRFGIGKRLHSLMRRMLGSAYSEAAFGSQVDVELPAMLRQKPGRLALGAACHLLGRSIILFEVYVGLRLIGVPFERADAVVLAVVPIGLSLFFSAVPSQVGVQEGGQALVAAALGLPPSVGVTLVLLQRFRQLAFAAVAPLLLNVARSPSREPARRA
jgi:hypothetical protein